MRFFALHSLGYATASQKPLRHNEDYEGGLVLLLQLSALRAASALRAPLLLFRVFTCQHYA